MVLADKDNTRLIPCLDNKEVETRLVLLAVVPSTMDRKAGMEGEGGIHLGCKYTCAKGYRVVCVWWQMVLWITTRHTYTTTYYQLPIIWFIIIIISSSFIFSPTLTLPLFFFFFLSWIFSLFFLPVAYGQKILKFGAPFFLKNNCINWLFFADSLIPTPSYFGVGVW